MRSLIIRPLNLHTSSRVICAFSLSTPSVRGHLFRSLLLPRTNSHLQAPTPSAKSFSTGLHGSSFLVSAVTPPQAARPIASLMSPYDDTALHVLALCRSDEDAARVHDLTKEVAGAAADSSEARPAMLVHLDPDLLPPHARPSLDAAVCFRRLAMLPAEGGTRTMGRVLLAAATLGSTQELLRTHGSALGDGAVAVADRQTSGKGRGGNQWTSPLGCLMFSALRSLRVSSPSQAPLINYLVCLAIIRGVRRALQEAQLPPLELRIKWPNDIYASGIKVAGALIHTTWQGGCFNVITGIGLNVNNRTPTTCLDELIEKAVAKQAAASRDVGCTTGIGAPGAAGVTGTIVSREAVLTGILAALEEVYDVFEQSGFTCLEPEYLATWMHSGQVIEFDDSDPVTAAAAEVGMAPAAARGGAASRLTIRGLSPSGFLLAEAVEGGGGQYELTPDGNSLDMMRGLIRRKVQ